MEVTFAMVGKVVGLSISGLVLMQVFVSFLGALNRVRLTNKKAKLDLKEFTIRIDGARVAVAKRSEQAELSWQGYRKFKVVRREAEDNKKEICSFYLAPHDGRKLPEFQPGQFLTFRLDIPGQKKTVVRCYSLSDAFDETCYRVSIKRVSARTDREGKELPAGVSSTYFHDMVKVGDILDVKAPAGKFFLDLNRGFPIVLLAGGVGVTPMMSMFQSVARLQPNRPMWFFYGVRNSDELMQAQHLLGLAGSTPSLRMYFCYSNPNERDERYCEESKRKHLDAVQRRLPLPGVNHIGKRVDMEWVRTVLPGESARDTHQFFICGPGPMLQAVTKSLSEWGVPDNHVHFEAFGPSTVKKSPKSTMQVSTQTCTVSFSKAGKTVNWTPDSGSLLDVAEEAGVDIDSGCRAGDCHSCKVAIKSGEVVYLKDPSDPPEAGTILACVAVPKADVVLDA